MKEIHYDNKLIVDHDITKSKVVKYMSAEKVLIECIREYAKKIYLNFYDIPIQALALEVLALSVKTMFEDRAAPEELDIYNRLKKRIDITNIDLAVNCKQQEEEE